MRVCIATTFFCALIASAIGPALSSSPTFVSDTYAGSQLGQFAYRGRWEHVRVMPDGRFLGTSSRTSTAGASVTLDFVGRTIRVYGVCGPGGGHGSIRLDGQPASAVDFYAKRKIARTIVYTSPVMEQKRHTITIQALGEPRMPGHRSAYINVSGAVYQ